MVKFNVDDKPVIVGAFRTPIAAIGGGLNQFQARELATIIMKEALKRTNIDPNLVDYTCLGWVMQDPRSPNIAKSSAEFAGVPYTSPGTTFHENCASGGAAIHSLSRRIRLGEVRLGLAGGVESMSNVPRYLYVGRNKSQLYGDMTLVDGVMGSLVDINVGKNGEVMGLMTERLVEKYKVSRELQDQIAFDSHQNALKTWAAGLFDGYVCPVEIPQRKGDPIIVAKDEGPKEIPLDKFKAAKPYFKPEGGTITSMNSSSINDAAAVLIIASQSRAKELGLKPLAYLYDYHNVGVPRELMGEGVFKVIPPLLGKVGLAIGDIDFYELNEAFAAVVGAGYMDIPALHKLSGERVNMWGSGISLGHPVGCTGARQVVDMVHQLIKRDKKVGLTSRCVGGGIGSGELIVKY
jgi:acetyl-CoA C-acetyltransferase